MSTRPDASFASAFLNKVFADELAAGNVVHQDGPGWGRYRRLVILRRPFRTTLPADLPEGVEHHLVNDPHYWQAELADTNTLEMLACGFAPPGGGG